MECFQNSRQDLFTGPGWIHPLLSMRIVNIQQVQTCDEHFQNVLEKETNTSSMDYIWPIIFVIIIQICLISHPGRAEEAIDDQGRKIISGDEFASRLRQLGTFENIELADNEELRQVPELKNVVVKGNIPDLTELTWESEVDISGSIIHNDLVFIECTFKNGLNFSQSIFLGELIFDDTKAHGGIDFSASNFESNVSFFGSEIGADPDNDYTENTYTYITFARSSFKKIFDFRGNKIYSQTSFENCRFYDIAIFGKASDDEFKNFRNGKQDVNSLSTIFSNPDKDVNFNESIFYHRANFTFTSFSNAKFNDVIFIGGAQFIKARFRGDTDFIRTNFKGLANFDRAIFYKIPTDPNGQSYANFYRSQFEDSASFSKAIFLIDTDFKRVSFKGKALFANTLFFSDTSFEMSFFDKEFLGAKINDTNRLIEELIYYGIGCGIKDVADANNRLTLREKIADIELRTERNQDEPLVKWKGKVACLDDVAIQILDDHNIPVYLKNENRFPVYRHNEQNNNEMIKTVFTGAHFNGEVDLREARFGEVNFSTGEMVTLFNGPVDFSNASFEKIYLDGTAFMNKVNLPFSESLFRSSGLVSEELTLFKIFSLFNKDSLRKGNDALVTRKDDNSLKKLYSQLEPLFRKNMQIVEANEMSVRLAGLKLRHFDDWATALFVFFAMPIKNIIFLAVIMISFFYLCLVVSILKKKKFFARTRELYFKPGKLPLIIYHNLEPEVDMINSPDGGKKKHIEHALRLWQKITWPLYLCLGTFFALFSLGNVYVTDDSGCLKKMKILRVAGFILLPLFLFSLAKRSVGLHSTVSFLF